VTQTGEDLALDLRALGKVLRERGVEMRGDLEGTRLGLGQSNLTYLATDDSGGRWIVRRPPRGQLLASAHDVLREARILSALVDTGVPVPRVFCAVTDDAVAEAPVVVMECIDGTVVDRMAIAEMLPMAVRRGLSRAIPNTLAAIHAVDLDAHGLSTIASHAPYAARQLRRWSRQWEQSKTRELAELDALTELLRRTAPRQQRMTLVHGDFHLRNLICAPESGDIRAVLDWELSTLGDPLADVGTMLAYWTQADDVEVGLFDASSLPGFVTRAELVEEYCRTAGVDDEHIDYWHALGLWKIAIIAEGVLRRALDEPSNAAEGGPGDPARIPLIIERAWQVLHAG
jgi:aminoglycoside phosphotransferase (APT) family kinase protein